MSCTEHAVLTRRSLLGGSAATLALWGFHPRAAAAGGRDARFLTIILRGGLDGLAMVAPVGDPDYAGRRGKLALTPALPALPSAGLPLDALFVLNPSMTFLHGLYQKREALIVHAVATPYRSRSHFDGQDVLESGFAGVGRVDDGWLNRALAGLPHGPQAQPKGLAMGAVVPLVMRGTAPVLSWSPKAYNLPPPRGTIERLAALYRETDPVLARAFAEGLDMENLSSGSAAAVQAGAKAGPKPFRDFVETAEAAARFMSSADGPRIGALSYDGWDTHANEGAIDGQLGKRLAGLDLAIATFAQGMGAAWKDTVVAVVTEFGRTVQSNGTEGTDHGTATAALVLGGRVNGGRVIADWPGLADKALFEGRDLKPTRDLRSVFKGILGDHLGLSHGALHDTVFPGSRDVRALDGIIKA